MKKKIIYIWKSPYPWDVRVEKICKSLSKEYEVLILAKWGGEPKKAELLDGITVRRVGFKEKSYKAVPLSLNPVWKKELNKIVDGYKPDLIIVREIMLGTLAGKVGMKNNIPVIMDMAENYPALMKLWRKYNNSFIKKFLMRILDIPRIVERNSLSYMNKVIVVCEEQIDRLNKQYGILTDKIKVVKNTPVKDYPKQVPGRNKTITFLHHGWLTEEKRIDNFLSSFIEVFGNNDNYKFVIAGSGNCLEEYKSTARNINNVEFTGEYNYKELEEIISNSSIGVLPYELNDFNNYTIHNKLFDYFALSKPVIVSQAKPLARIVEGSNTGYVVDCENHNSIVEFFKNEKFDNLSEMSTNSYSAYKGKYNWQHDEKKLLNLVSKII